MPDSLHSLLEFLREHPSVILTCGTSITKRSYYTYKDGNIWWKLEDGTFRKMPIMRMLADNIVMIFDKNGFSLMKDHITHRFDYERK